MNYPLEKYRVIATSNFIHDIEDKFYIIRYSELCHNGVEFEVTRERDNNRLKIVGIDIWGEGFISYETLSYYFITEYNKLEVEARSEVEKFMMLHLEEKEQQVFIKNIIAELQILQVAISKNPIDSKYEVYRSILLDKLILFSQLLGEIYLSPSKLLTPKIQWLGKTNILATLFYDLWQGQDKIKEPSTKSLIKAQKKDLEAFLINNFLDEKGNPLSESTISDYLNSSKPEKRAKKGIRIELNF